MVSECLPKRRAQQDPSLRTAGVVGKHCTMRMCFSGSPSTITFRSQAGNFACQPFELVCLCHETYQGLSVAPEESVDATST